MRRTQQAVIDLKKMREMEANGARRGLAGLCIGGGEALAIIVELMS